MGKKKSTRAQSKQGTTQDTPGGGFGALGAMLSSAGFKVSGSAPPKKISTNKAEKSTSTSTSTSKTEKSTSKTEKSTSKTKTDDIGLRGCPRAVVRVQRKGFGGKTVTLIEKLAISEIQHTLLARKLGKTLGCGVRAQDQLIIIQGDQRSRISAWLKQAGVKKVTV